MRPAYAPHAAFAYGDPREDDCYQSDGDEALEKKHTMIVKESKKMDREITQALRKRANRPELVRGQGHKKLKIDEKEAIYPLEHTTKENKENETSEFQEYICDKEGYIKNPPASSMTGVDPRITRLCAALSGQIYQAKSEKDFNLSNQRLGLKVEILKFDTHGKLAETTPPFVVVVVGKAMICGWRGSSTLMDWVMDFAFAPSASSRWIKTAKSVRAQSGYCALVESELSLHEDFLVQEMKERNIEELIFTGHSLAGGIAQVAHLFVEGSRVNKRCVWADSHLHKVTIRTIAFSAPMTTVNLDRATDPASVQFVNKVGATMCNIIFESDPVPRAYAHLEFINKVIRNAIPQMVQGIRLPRTVKWLFDIHGRAHNVLERAIDGNQALFRVAESYRHIGNVIYYEDDLSMPLLYKDKGFNYSKPEGSRERLFYDIEYKQSNDVIKTATDNHLFLVRGPGLAYGVEATK